MQDRSCTSGGKLCFSIENNYFYANCSRFFSVIVICSFKILALGFLIVNTVREHVQDSPLDVPDKRNTKQRREVLPSRKE